MGSEATEVSIDNGMGCRVQVNDMNWKYLPGDVCRATAGQQSCQQAQVVAVSNDSVAGTSSASTKLLVGVGVNQELRGRVDNTRRTFFGLRNL